MEKRRAFLSGEVLVAPMHEPDQDRVKAQTSLGQAIFKARRRLLVGDFRENTVFHQMCEPFRQYASRDAKPRLKVVEAADTQKRFTQYKQRPPIADHRERPRQRAIFLIEVLPSHRARTLPLTPSYFKTYWLRQSKERACPAATPHAPSSAPAISSDLRSPENSHPRATQYSPAAGRRRSLSRSNARSKSAGGACEARGLDARKEDEVTAFLQAADAHAPLEVVIINPGANVNFPILETTERVFFKVWEMACKAGFLTGVKRRASC